MVGGAGTPRSVHVLTLALAAASAALAAFVGVSRAGAAWAVMPLMVLLVVAGLCELRFEYRGHVEALDLFEAALMPVVVLTPGVGAVLIAATAKAVSQRLLGVPGVKARFNIAQWAAVAGVTSVLFVELRDALSTADSQLAVLAPAMLGGILVNHFSVVVVLGLVNRQSIRTTLGGLEKVVIVGWLAGGAVNISFGLLFAGAAMSSPALIPLFVVPLGLLHWASQGYAEARAERERIQALQLATHELTSPVEPDRAIAGFLAAVRSSFESCAVDLVVNDTDRRLIHSGSTDTRELSRAIVAAAATSGRAVRASRDDESAIGRVLAESPRRACLFTPVRHGTSLKGWLISYDRYGFAGFEAGEISVFEALAAELGSALERFDLLHSLVREREHLFEIVDRSSDAIFTIAGDGQIETWNPAMERLTGYALHELVGPGLACLRPKDTSGRGIRIEDHVASGGAGLPSVIEIITSDGERRWVGCSYAATAAARSSLVVVARDMTRQREVDQLKDDFVATISHELQTPLTTIMGFTDLLIDAHDTIAPARQQEVLGIIRKGTRRLGRLISNLLELSRVEARGHPIASKAVDVNDVCLDVIEEVQETYPNADVRFEPVTGALTAVGNPLSVEQILTNLVGNALKYAPDQPVEIHIDELRDAVAIRVVDHGPGIPRAFRERVFDRFERLDQDHVQAGTGLGLYISRQLASAMNGRITVDSEVGRGSTFTLILPAELQLASVG